MLAEGTSRLRLAERVEDASLILARRTVEVRARESLVESIVGVGSTFTFALPLALAAPPKFAVA